VNPTPTPADIEPAKVSKNLITTMKKCSPDEDWRFTKDIVLYNDIAIASFRTDSPKTKAYRLTSVPTSWNIESTVTGSVADISAPNIRHSTKGSLYMRYIEPPR
jgi:hypothetical protein